MISIAFKIALFIHVICGFLSLVSGTVAMASKKGSKLHNKSGIVFYWSMFVVFVTTVIFFVLYPANLKYQFFLGIGIVSFYPNWSGKRMLAMKKGLIPSQIDKVMGWLIGVSGLIMIAYGLYLTLYPNPSFSGLNILFFIFGTVSLTNCYGDLKYYLGYAEAEKMHWFFAHGGKMIGAYSAAWTAFCVNIVPRYLPKNLPGFIQIAVWVVPGVVIAIIGRIILKRYRMKFKV